MRFFCKTKFLIIITDHPVPERVEGRTGQFFQVCITTKVICIQPDTFPHLFRTGIGECQQDDLLRKYSFIQHIRDTQCRNQSFTRTCSGIDPCNAMAECDRILLFIGKYQIRQGLLFPFLLDPDRRFGIITYLVQAAVVTCFFATHLFPCHKFFKLWIKKIIHRFGFRTEIMFQIICDMMCLPQGNNVSGSFIVEKFRFKCILIC